MDPFLQAAAAAPHDQTLRLVYADWLEEQGDPRAEFLRIQVALLRLEEGDPGYPSLMARKEALRPSLDEAWLTQLGYSHPIERMAQTVCELSTCPRYWNALRATEQPDVRFCGTCQSHVHYCGQTEAILSHVERSHVLAVPVRRRQISRRATQANAQADAARNQPDTTHAVDLSEINFDFLMDIED